MKIMIKVDGLKEIKQALDQLPRATSRNVQRRILMNRAQPIAAAAENLVPVDKGELKNTIAVSTKLTRRQRGIFKPDGPKDVNVFIGPSAVPQAIMQEFGTFKERAQPFMRPAWDAEGLRVLENIKNDLWSEIEIAAERLARKAARKAAKAARGK